VRWDKKKSSEFRNSDEWGVDFAKGENLETGTVDQATGKTRLHSFSAKERNCLFLNRQGQQFTDISLVSGVDNIADGRSFVYWDYDRDGWQDIAVVNANSPLLSFYRNTIGRLSGNGSSAGRIIALRYVGGNRSAAATTEMACRDGYGARVDVDLGDFKVKREHRCGEGFCAQNSATMIIGIGNHDAARSLTVRWPSGRFHTIEDVPHGTLLTAYENTSESADGSGFDSAPYRGWAQVGHQPIARHDEASAKLNLSLSSDPSSPSDQQTGAALRMYTTMATWCAACKKHLPQFETLRSAFTNGELDIYGVPIDPEDTPTKLKTYESRFQPAYKLLVHLTPAEREKVHTLLNEDHRTAALPSTIVTDAQGHVLQSRPDVPTVSDVRKLTRNQMSPEGRS